MTEYMENGFHFYARLLGIRKNCEKLLSLISANSSIPLLARLSESENLTGPGAKMLRNDILAPNLFMSVVTNKFKTAFRNEYRQGLLKI